MHDKPAPNPPTLDDYRRAYEADQQRLITIQAARDMFDPSRQKYSNDECDRIFDACRKYRCATTRELLVRLLDAVEPPMPKVEELINHA